MISDLHSAWMGSEPYQIVLVAVLGALLPVFVFLYNIFMPLRYPSSLARIGSDKGISWKDMKHKFVTDCVPVFEEVYEKYSKKDRAVLIPVGGPFDEVILPPSLTNWLVKQKDEEVSSLAAQVDSIQLEHSLGYKFAFDPWGGHLLKADLNSQIDKICELMSREIAPTIDESFGMDTENWKDVDLFPVARTFIARATMCFSLGDSPVGEKLRKDMGFIEKCFGVLDGMLETAGEMAGIRRPLRRFYGARVAKKHGMTQALQGLEDGFRPLYEERMKMLTGNEKPTQQPLDLMQTMLEHAMEHRPEEARSIQDMTRRLAVLNFGTLHQSVVTLINLVLDIVDSNPKHDTLSTIRDEVLRVLSQEGQDPSTPTWNKASLSRLIRTDSVQREVMRTRSFLGRSVQRLVIAPNGVYTPDGTHLPKGTMVSVLAHQTQLDPENCPGDVDPEEFDPFRFSRCREAAADPKTGRPGLNNLSFVSTSATYLPFSHGKHACPGRSVVDLELKMILAYIALNYEVTLAESYEGKRPPNMWFSGFGVPPLDAKIRVKRRAAGAAAAAA